MASRCVFTFAEVKKELGIITGHVKEAVQDPALERVLATADPGGLGEQGVHRAGERLDQEDGRLPQLLRHLVQEQAERPGREVDQAGEESELS